jgi:hypothetical protein
VVDGVEEKEYDDLGPGSIAFGPDSKHLAYLARRGANMFVVVDGHEAKGYDTFVRGSKPVFDSPTSLHAIAMQGNSFVRVSVEIAEGKP